MLVIRRGYGSKTNLVYLRSVRSIASLRDVEKELVQNNATVNRKATKSTKSTQATPTVKVKIPFQRANIGDFFQSPPELGNQYLGDATLVSALKRILPPKVLRAIAPDLERFGGRVAGELRALAAACERDPPHLVPYDPWGRRVDTLVTCPAWRQQKAVSAEEGLIATAYTRQHGPWSRLHQVAKNYLYAPSSGMYSCPLAMTDGAATIIQNLGEAHLQPAFARLTSVNPAEFWTSGQWMTERRGGSDVAGGTETVAVQQGDGSFRLYGYKWFSSATDSDITFTLARILDTAGHPVTGSAGLSMFYLEVRDVDGHLNGIELQRLKDKLGTRQLPTAELLLDGAKATLVSEEGRGVAAIADMLTVTRIHNTISSAANMRRILNLSRDYAHRRVAFGKLLKDYRLHIKHLANMEVEQRGALLLTLDLGRLLGHVEVGMATEEEQDLLRLLTPLSKLYTGKQDKVVRRLDLTQPANQMLPYRLAVAVVSEGLECFGGMGYLEDTGLPGLLRDTQVLPIWEGTTNILSLDVLRSIVKSRGSVLKAYHSAVSRSCAAASPHLQDIAQRLQSATDALLRFAANQKPEVLEAGAREFAFSLARTYMGCLFLEHASWAEATPHDVHAVQRWCAGDLTPCLTSEARGHYTPEVAELERLLVFDGYTAGRQ